MCSASDRRSIAISIVAVALATASCAGPTTGGVDGRVASPAATPVSAPDLLAAPAVADAGVLRVCADPNNLPFSNDRGEGFENALAELVASELGRRVEYTWWPQRRGFFRLTLRAGVCDVVMGVPVGFEMARTTLPYYRSSYVFVTRGDRRLDLRSLDDERLRRLRIGIHVIGDDYSNVPPGDALLSRGIVDNVRGYSIYGDYRQPNPPAGLVDAVQQGQIDVAIAWGPLGGYFAARAEPPLRVAPVPPTAEAPMAFAIAMGVRREDEALHDAVSAVLSASGPRVDAILDRFHVPRLPLTARRAARSEP
jgi:quinoprotein dehydrogenase-associated probable ABC transporter substrate-binding protein